MGERGSGLKTVRKVKVARLGCCSLTGGKHDAALRGKEITLAFHPVSILFYFSSASDMVLCALNLSE